MSNTAINIPIADLKEIIKKKLDKKRKVICMDKNYNSAAPYLGVVEDVAKSIKVMMENGIVGSFDVIEEIAPLEDYQDGVRIKILVTPVRPNEEVASDEN